MTTLKTATTEDFKIGAVLRSSCDNDFRLHEKYEEGIWDARRACSLRYGEEGGLIYEHEAKHYKLIKAGR